MELRSGKSHFLEPGEQEDFPSLRGDTSCEVAILGGGITGALIAHELLGEGADIVILDKRDTGTGSTAASTSLLQHAFDTDLVDLAPLIGEEAAAHCFQLGLEAVAKLGEIARSLEDDCGYERKSTLYLASSPEDAEKLRRECKLRRKYGLNSEYLEAQEVHRRFHFSAPAAIISTGDAQVDAFRFTQKLLAKCHDRGCRIFDRTSVTRIEEDGGKVLLTADSGAILRAGTLVFATGYESQQYLKQSIGSLSSTFALATEPVSPFPEWPDRCLIWETARPYCYFRSTDDARIVIGGMDVPFGGDHEQKRMLEEKTAALHGRLRSMFPAAALNVASAWAGTFASTGDGLPYIGRSSEWKNAYFALGYGGNGITMSLVAAELFRDDFCGRKNPDRELFRFDRPSGRD